MKFEITIPKKLKGFNQMSFYGGIAHRHIRRGELGRWKAQFLSYLVPHADAIRAIADKGIVQISVTYRQVRPYDSDNALHGVNKLIIDPMVKKGMLDDDTISKIDQTVPRFEKCKKGQESITLRFATRREDDDEKTPGY